jgi:TetR/AcrR family transcriptional regulator, cholesterol catabolism regulator
MSRPRKVPATKSSDAGGPRRRAPDIIEAAARVFAERGFHGASTQDIADVLGIRQASLYYYFRSKEAALEQVCARGVEGYLDAALAIADGPGTAAEKLRRLIAMHLHPLQDRADFVKVFLKERQHLPTASRRRIGTLTRNYEAAIEKIMRAGMRAGEFRRDLDCRIATLALLGMLNSVAAWYRKESNATVERIGTEFARLLVDGAAARPKRRAQP